MIVVKPKPRYRILKRSLAVAGTLVLILFATHLWFVHNARTILKGYIIEQSRGKIKLELSELHLNVITKRLQIHEADLVSTDSIHEPITYHVTFSKLTLNVRSVWDLIFRRKLQLDSLKLYNPKIQVIQWRKDTTQSVIKDELSIPQEMGKVYNSLISALDAFEIRRIIIDNASISLINKTKPRSETVTLSNIFFDLARTPVKQGNQVTYLKGEQTVELRTLHQNILLPGGRHRLSFKSFNLQLFRQSIQLDSCTVTAMATDSLKSSYKIFFKKLFLSGVDFAALSSKNLVKADTVFCEDPFFDINIHRADAVKKKTQIPDPDKIIRELAGNLNLAYVGVKNAGIHFDIYGRTKRSFYNSNKDGFEIRSFRINPDSSQPVSIGRFDMTLRDYHLYNEDSSSLFSFDSLHFLNSRIVLNNFSIFSGPGRNKLRNEVDIKVPYFELSQLDWYQLVFEQNMIAKEAVLNSPVINFTRKKVGTPGKKLDLFNALLNVDSLVALENVTILNGQVNMRLGPTTSFSVQNIHSKVFSNKLLHSTTKEGLRSAVEHLSFSNGELRLKDITVRLHNARFTNNNLMYAGKVAISGQGNKIAGIANNVYIDNMQLDDDAETIDVDGLGWESATVALKALPRLSGRTNENNNSTIRLRNIQGNNTRINFSNGPTAVSTYVQTITASSLLKQGDDIVRVEGFRIAGRNLLVNTPTVKVNADEYKVSSSETSSLTDVQVEQVKDRDSINIQCSKVSFSTDLNDLFVNDVHLTNVHAIAPDINIVKWHTNTATPDSTNMKSPIRIDKLTATEPKITISTHRNDSATVINIPWSDNSLVQASGINLSGEGMQIGSLLVNTTAATYKKSTGEILGVESGKINMDLSDIAFGRNNGKISWRGLINNLDVENPNGLQIGKRKNNLRFQQASLGSLNLSSEFVPDFTQLMKANVSAWLRIPQGEFIDSTTTMQWYNARYNNTNRTLTLDSFIYHPTLSLDSVLAHAPYQLDYLTLKSGAVIIDGLDVARYEKDSAFIANAIKINNPVLTVYKDKGFPSAPFKKDKPLPVNLIKLLSLPISIEYIRVEDGTITYGEKNGKSRREGTLLLADVNATLGNIKNTDLTNTDSLALTFNARLMDHAGISIDLKQSYTDSLGGFLMTAKVKSSDMTLLNPFLVPVANVRVASGVLDSVSLTAVGRDDLAFGEMNMHYHKLRVQFIKDGDPDKSTTMQKVLGFIANTFIIRRNNTARKGLIYFDHISTQSFVNYIVKTTLSGVASSVGFKKNRKYMKRYEQRLADCGHPGVKL
jgi:hypothetical protein